MEESGANEAECCRRELVSGRRIESAIRSLVNARNLQLECARVLHELLLVPVLTYGSEIMIWKEKERSRFRVVQIENLRGLLGIRRMDKVPNARVRELCGVTEGVDERIDEGVLRWFGHVERMENNRIAKRIFVGRGGLIAGKTDWMSGKEREWFRIRNVWRGFVRGVRGMSPKGRTFG